MISAYLLSCGNAKFSSGQSALGSQQVPEQQTVGGDKDVQKDPEQPQASNQDPQDSKKLDPTKKPEVTSECPPAGLTQGRLLTTSVKNGAQGQVLEYHLSLASCDGKALPLKGKTVNFDFDAVIDAKNLGSLRYEIARQQSPSTILQQGTVAAVRGSDLFGKSGPNFFFYSTSALSYSGEDAEIIFRLHLAPALIYPFNNPDGRQVPDSFMLSTYLRIGVSKPLTTKVEVRK